MSFSVGGSIFWSGTSHRWRRLRRGGNGSSTSRWACYIGSMIERTGHCLCGAVRFRLSAEPLATRVCWCRDCQHLSANGLANLLVPTAALEISGQVREFVRTAQSGNKIQQRFCPRADRLCSQIHRRGRRSRLCEQGRWTTLPPCARQRTSGLAALLPGRASIRNSSASSNSHHRRALRPEPKPFLCEHGGNCDADPGSTA